jgi:hypothetical protein
MTTNPLQSPGGVECEKIKPKLQTLAANQSSKPKPQKQNIRP